MARIADYPINQVDELLPWSVVDQLDDRQTVADSERDVPAQEGAIAKANVLVGAGAYGEAASVLKHWLI